MISELSTHCAHERQYVHRHQRALPVVMHRPAACVASCRDFLLCHLAGMYDEKVLVGLDFAINEASKRGIRVVPVFANYWAMYGGIDQYNTWSFEAGSGEPLAQILSVLPPGALCPAIPGWPYSQKFDAMAGWGMYVRCREDCMSVALTRELCRLLKGSLSS